MQLSQVDQALSRNPDLIKRDLTPEVAAMWDAVADEMRRAEDRSAVAFEEHKKSIDMLSDCVRDASMEALNRNLKIPSMKSFFFYGPPGCGKTYIIEAFAHELMQQGYKFMSLSSADIHSKFSGEADKIVQRAFREAVDNAPCILFMDEVDGVCQNRNLPNLSDFNMQLTTTFLTAYNGLSRANAEQKSVIFIGATNYPANVDAAMLDRVELVRIPLPEEVRGQVFRSALEDIVRLEPGLGWLDMAVATEGYNQRDVKAIIEKLKKLIRVGAADGCTSGEEPSPACRTAPSA